MRVGAAYVTESPDAGPVGARIARSAGGWGASSRAPGLWVSEGIHPDVGPHSGGQHDLTSEAPLTPEVNMLDVLAVPDSITGRILRVCGRWCSPCRRPR